MGHIQAKLEGLGAWAQGTGAEEQRLGQSVHLLAAGFFQDGGKGGALLWPRMLF